MNLLAENAFYVLALILFVAMHLFGLGGRNPHSSPSATTSVPVQKYAERRRRADTPLLISSTRSRKPGRGQTDALDYGDNPAAISRKLATRPPCSRANRTASSRWANASMLGEQRSYCNSACCL